MNHVSKAVSRHEAVGTQYPQTLVKVYALHYLLTSPLILVLLLSFVGAGQLASHLPPLLAFCYWAGLLLPKWWAMTAMAWLFLGFDMFRRPPVPVTLAFAAVVACIVYRPVSAWMVDRWLQGASAYLPSGFHFEGLTLGLLDGPATLMIIAFQNLMSITLWTLITLACMRLFDLQSLGLLLRPPGIPTKSDADVDAAGDGGPVAGQPVPARFFAELSDGLRGDLLAVEAQDHYIMVHMTAAQELLLYRFRDAVADLKDWDGQQVHRSFWVARSGVVSAVDQGGVHRLTLANGVEVPVSRSWLSRAREAGLFDSAIAG